MILKPTTKTTVGETEGDVVEEEEEQGCVWLMRLRSQQRQVDLCKFKATLIHTGTSVLSSFLPPSLQCLGHLCCLSGP